MHHRHNRLPFYKSYSLSTSSQNSYYLYYDPRLRTRLSFHSHTSPVLHQPYEPHTSLADLAEPLSVFDNLSYSTRRPPSPEISLPALNLPSNPGRQSSLIDARLTVANVMREKLLNDIQDNIREIDRELTSLGQRPAFPRFLPPTIKRSARSEENIQIQIEKSKRLYEVIPRIPSEKKPPENPLPHPASPPIEQTTSQVFHNNYHYGAELEETEIGEDDPENCDFYLTTRDLPKSNSYNTMSPTQFHRIQSSHADNRALISLPEFADDSEAAIQETTKDLQLNQSKQINNLSLSTVPPSNFTGSSNKLNIEDFQSLIQTASEPNNELPDEDLASTIISKSTQQLDLLESNKTEENPTYFFSDFGNANEGEEDVISIDPNHFAIPFDNHSIRQSQVSLPNPHSSSDYLQQQQQQQQAQQQLSTETENEKRIDTSTLPSKKTSAISISDNTQTQSTRANSHVNENQQNLTRREEQRSSSMSSHRQYSASPTQSNNVLLSRNESITQSDIRSNQQATNPNNSSSIPIRRDSPEENHIRPISSRSATPERRNSIPTIDQNFLLNSDEILSFHESNSLTQDVGQSTDDLQIQTHEIKRLDSVSPLPPPPSLPMEFNDLQMPLLSLKTQTHTDVPPMKIWRQRIDKILSKKPFPQNKYAHVKSRVNTFEHFEYRPGQIIIPPKRKYFPIKKPERKIFGKLTCSSDGRLQIFNQVLRWNVQSKLKSYANENIHYRPPRSQVKIFNEKPQWRSESKLRQPIKKTPRLQRFIQLPILPPIINDDQSELKIFDINSVNTGLFNPRKLVFNEKLAWTKKSKIKDTIWKNINYRQKKATVQTNQALFSEYQNFDWNDINDSSLAFQEGLGLPIDAEQIFDENKKFN